MRIAPLLACLAAFVASTAAAPAAAQMIEGTARAIDGDTLDMTGTRIRLVHIDAPETRQGCERDGELWACGTAASAALAEMIEAQPIACRAIERDVYGRQVALCRTKLFDLGEEMIRRGMAIAAPGAPEDYRAAQALAKRRKAGIWTSDFTLPSAWRAAHAPAPSPPPQQADARARKQQGSGAGHSERIYRSERGCLIKGNRNRRGEWIYHLPGRPYYDRTKPEEIFCTESEARAAGYRRSRA